MVITEYTTSGKNIIENPTYEEMKLYINKFIKEKEEEIDKSKRDFISNLEQQLKLGKITVESKTKSEKSSNNNFETNKNSLEELSMNINQLIAGPTINCKKDVVNLDRLLFRLNKETNGKYNSIQKTAKKESDKYLKMNYKSKYNQRIKPLKKLASKNSYLNKTSAHTKILQFGAAGIKISDVIKSFIETGKKSISYNSGLKTTDLKDFRFESKNSYSFIKSKLDSREVRIWATTDIKKGNNKIEEIEAKYQNLLKNSSILNLLEQAMSLSKTADSQGNVFDKTQTMIEKEYQNVKKIVDDLYLELQKDTDYLDSIIKNENVEEESKHTFSDVKKDMKEKIVNGLDNVIDKMEESQQLKEEENLDKNFEKILEQKIVELDDSLSYSVSEFKKFKELDEEKQAFYKQLVKESLKNRVGKTNQAKALIDAKLQLKIESSLYGQQKDILTGITEVSQIPSLDAKNRQYLDSFERKLEYVESETMFKDYEKKLKQHYENIKRNFDSASPLLNSTMKNYVEEDQYFKGGKSL